MTWHLINKQLNKEISRSTVLFVNMFCEKKLFWLHIYGWSRYNGWMYFEQEHHWFRLWLVAWWNWAITSWLSIDFPDSKVHGPAWGPHGADRTQVGPMLAPWTLLSGLPIKSFNTMRLRQNGWNFADDTYKRIFLNENVRIWIEVSLKFVPKGAINNIAALIQIIAWRWPGDKPLSEPMMVRLPTHICVTQPQWIKNIFQCGLRWLLDDIWVEKISKK